MHSLSCRSGRREGQGLRLRPGPNDTNPTSLFRSPSGFCHQGSRDTLDPPINNSTSYAFLCLPTWACLRGLTKQGLGRGRGFPIPDGLFSPKEHRVKRKFLPRAFWMRRNGSQGKPETRSACAIHPARDHYRVCGARVNQIATSSIKPMLARASGAITGAGPVSAPHTPWSGRYVWLRYR